ncbi:MAG: tRNA uridine-5-carboxymethylaminomethyl(34) synthesis GTPase MnmE [Rhizorhabdus sp.]|nr:tRNA uridine-5-carboxymethylaminomethyl(34) synthesis GTPase MnmE [Rhizorhabdus sp.]
MPAENDPGALSIGDTIFALSSGQPPAGIAVVRISGPMAGGAVDRLTSARPEPRRAVLRNLADSDGGLLDRALVLWFPGPATATGEDLAELHLHGGRAVVAAVLDALGRMPGLRPAVAGEFTRRAFDHGRIDLIEAEALGDLLAAETEGQRRSAMILADGRLSRAIAGWQERLLMLSAAIEAMLDFADEDDVDADTQDINDRAITLGSEVRQWLAWPAAERLRDGIRVVLAGPPNAGKSTLLNALAGRDAAIVTEIAGTTRDLIEVPVALEGIAFVITDTAGLHDSADLVEQMGMARATAAMATADIVLWLGAPEDRPDHPRTMSIGAQSDRRLLDPAIHDVLLSARTGEGMADLIQSLLGLARCLLPGEGEGALNRRQRDGLGEVVGSLDQIGSSADPVLVAEGLRAARIALDALTGRAGTEDMFDRLFGAFCIGK